MKKNLFSLAAIALVIGLSSCSSSSSFEKDVTKMADYRCQIQKLSAKDPNDEAAKKELEAVTKEMDEYRDKMAKKYEDKKNDSTMNAKAEKIMDDVMAKCK